MSRRTVFALAVILLATGAMRAPERQVQPGSHPTRRALVIGINHYLSGSTSAQRSAVRWSDLEGAVNDARAIQELLRRQYGFEEKNILVLLDRAASRKAILDAVEKHLIAPSRPGDEVVFFYSGHGSQVPNSASDEPDKMDESLVPADSNRKGEDLRDKELARLFNRILDRGARLTVIFDSCYSGGASRGLPPGVRARFLPPATRGVVDAAPTGGRPEDRGALILSAAQDFQLAHETPGWAGEPHGAFSLSFLEALGRALPGESAEETFLRASALLGTRELFQQPVLSGSSERRRAPLFGGKAASVAAGTVVAVQQVKADGTVMLQGGWIQGLREGVELEIRTARTQEAPPRLRVTRILGPSAAEAKPVEIRAERRLARVKAGDLAQLSRWVITNEPTLRLWIPEAGPQWEQHLRWAGELRELARGAGVEWVSDPVEQTPSHVLRRQQDEWWLTPAGAESRSLGPAPAPLEVLRQVRAGAERPSLFVQLPAPPGLARDLALGRGTPHDAVERTPDRARAQYELAGRLSGDHVEFAWIRPAVARDDVVASKLPPRSDWCSMPEQDCASVLTDSALRINKIRAWLTLPSPPGDRFPYRLWLVAENGKTRREGALHAGEQYGLLVRAEQESLRYAGSPRYLYVFTIDSFGNSTLLFPRSNQGSVENRFPIFSTSGDSWPPEIRLSAGPVFGIAEPFGVDSFFLLSTDELIPNPWIVQFPGVRSRGPRGDTSLEELLSQTGSAKRGVEPFFVPVTWSLERLTFATLPALGESLRPTTSK